MAVADRTKQGNTPNDDNDVVVFVAVFFLFTSALRLCFPSALRTVFVVCVACVATCSDI